MPAFPVATWATRIWDIRTSSPRTCSRKQCILPRMGRVDDKDVLISGGARNIGGASARHPVAEFGKLNVLFNNAGIFYGGQLQRYKAEQWQQMIDVNLTGAFFGAKHSADAIIAAGGGSIINTSSIEGLR